MGIMNVLNIQCLFLSNVSLFFLPSSWNSLCPWAGGFYLLAR
uniref:Uncharacterized protein n=1 Tax=Rhizophora mucronata TaxID=61149 RepID=A0A2P2IML3_RHIMU